MCNKSSISFFAYRESTKKLIKEDIFELLNIPLSPVRMKCALLSLDTLKNTVKIYEEYGKKNEKLRNKRFTR